MEKLRRPDLVRKLQQLAVSMFRPPEIITLEAWINGEQRALDVRIAVLGHADEEAIIRSTILAQRKRFLGMRYIEWAKQELALEQSQQPTA